MENTILFICISVLLSSSLHAMEEKTPLDQRREQLLVVYHVMQQEYTDAVNKDSEYCMKKGIDGPRLSGIKGDKIVKKYWKAKRARMLQEVYGCKEEILDADKWCKFKDSVKKTAEIARKEHDFVFTPEQFIVGLSKEQVDTFYSMYKKMGKIVEK